MGVSRGPLSEKETALLREVVESQGEHLAPAVDQLLAGELLSAEDADRLRGAIGEELALSGLVDEEGDVNERGIELDLLIDRVGALSHLFDE